MLGFKLRNSPCASIENDSCKLIVENRKKGRKFSMCFLRTTARKRMKMLQPVQADIIKGTVGWFQRFIKRKSIKFRKHKSGNEHDGKENLYKIIEVRNVFN